MRFFSALAFATLLPMFALADLATDCYISDKTACPLNANDPWAEFILPLPNYEVCGVKVLSNTYPDAARLLNFAQGLYVIVGPRWDLMEEVSPNLGSGNLTYAAGSQQWFSAYFQVFTRSGASLNDHIQQTLATQYQPSPTVTFVAESCAQISAR